MPTLFIAGIPLDKNTKDISDKLSTVLKNADLLIAEDRKIANRVLSTVNKRDLSTLLINEHSTDLDRQEAYKLILNNKITVFISDAGTPCISDPDYKIVNFCIDNGIKVLSIPGPSSVTTAISISGFNANRFSFMGFPPKNNPERTVFFKEIQTKKEVVVFMERPYKIKQTLEDLKNINKLISVSFNMGEHNNDNEVENEKTYRGKASSLIKIIPEIKAPFTIVVDKKTVNSMR